VSSRGLAERTVAEQDWTPNGCGSSIDLEGNLRNLWEFTNDVGAIPADAEANIKKEGAVDDRSLP